MAKRFVYKVTSLDGTAVGDLHPKSVISTPSFRERINSGQGQMLIQYKTADFDDFDTALIAHRNIISLYVISDEDPLGVLIYRGFISRFTPFVKGREFGVKITCMGPVSLAKKIFYKNGSNFEVVHSSDDPAVIVKAVIDYFSTKYPGILSYSAGYIDNVGTGIDYTFTDRRCRDAITDAAGYTDEDWWYRFDPDGQVRMQAKPTTPTHLFTIGKDIEELEIMNDNEPVVNALQYRYDGGTTDFVDAASQTAYGPVEDIEDNQNTSDSTTVNQYGDKLMDEEGDPKIKVKLVINAKYNLESIRVGDTCSVLGLKLNSSVIEENMQIVSVRYAPDKVTIGLDDESTLAKELKTLVEDLT
jgi:hypothetical protein